MFSLHTQGDRGDRGSPGAPGNPGRMGRPGQNVSRLVLLLCYPVHALYVFA